MQRARDCRKTREAKSKRAGQVGNEETGKMPLIFRQEPSRSTSRIGGTYLRCRITRESVLEASSPQASRPTRTKHAAKRYGTRPIISGFFLPAGRRVLWGWLLLLVRFWLQALSGKHLPLHKMALDYVRIIVHAVQLY